jgi:hypothetical protein
VLLAAARWAAIPAPAASCATDPDFDGRAECILASQQVFALIETDSGGLAFLFVRGSSDGSTAPSPQSAIHQLVGPSSQLISGQSNPGGWDLSAGPLADPAVIPGAFFDRDPQSETQLQLRLEDSRLEFFTEDGYTKIYSLLPAGLRADFDAPAPLTLRLPLLLDPWTRFSPAWGGLYQSSLSENGWTWGLAGGQQVRVAASTELTPASFMDTQSLMGTLEDPNRDYPPGHFLPFPLALAELHGQAELWVEIVLQ